AAPVGMGKSLPGIIAWHPKKGYGPFWGSTVKNYDPSHRTANPSNGLSRSLEVREGHEGAMYSDSSCSSCHLRAFVKSCDARGTSAGSRSSGRAVRSNR